MVTLLLSMMTETMSNDNLFLKGKSKNNSFKIQSTKQEIIQQTRDFRDSQETFVPNNYFTIY